MTDNDDAPQQQQSEADAPQQPVGLMPIADALGIDPSHTSLAQAGELARIFVASGYFADTKRLSQGIVKIYAGRELGLPPMAAMRELQIIEGKISLSANLVAALIRKNDRYKFKVRERTDTACTLEFFERERESRGWGEWESQGTVRFSLEDAQRANLVRDKGAWKKWPRAMCFARAVTEGARTFCSDIFEGGVYGEGEIEEARGQEPVLEVAEWGGTSKVIDATTGEVVAEAYVDEDAPADPQDPEVVVDDAADRLEAASLFPIPADLQAEIANLIAACGYEDSSVALFDELGQAAPLSIAELPFDAAVRFRDRLAARCKQEGA